jgi:SpoVK/Ycf46/Vps4 family AAA+-type ATPase
MASVRELAALFRSLGLRDIGGAENIARDIIAAERKRGRAAAAQMLSAALNSADLSHGRPNPQIAGTAREFPFLASALTLRHESVHLSDVMLRPSALQALKDVVKETRFGDLLRAKGICRRSKLIFIGPPGCGKTMTAQAMAGELGLPLYVVRFDAVIGSYLGQTASHLRELFQFAATTPSVLLFDEVDALGKQRGSSLDVGELDRIVIAMMQELELTSFPGLLIATSNLPKSIDRALWRRFDMVLDFPAPAARELEGYAKRLARDHSIGMTRGVLVRLAKLKSYAEARKIVESAAREALLKELQDGV